MYHFFELSLSFPVVLFSFLLALASLGLLGVETLNISAEPGILYYVLGVLVAVGASILAFKFTAAIVCGVRPMLQRIKGPPVPPLCGQVAIVHSAVVTRNKGRASVNDGGAGLLLQWPWQ